jgi:glycosyltransferase involved in cell wall biosynthesis
LAVLDLTVAVISWKRPRLLRDTLKSIQAQLEGITAHIVVVDNETNPDTRAVIEEASVDWWPVPDNKGINWPLQHLIEPHLTSEFLCVSDHDLHYSRPFKDYLDFLKDNPDVSYCKGAEGPEHAAFGVRDHRGERWKLKHSERGGGLILSTKKFRSTFPLPTNRLIDWDWHCIRTGGVFAVLPGTVAHTGYNDSTRAPGEIVPETHLLVDGAIVSNPDYKPSSDVPG